MTREQKIEALAEEYGKNSRHLKTSTHFRDGMLAGIALRDAELLAMEFDENKSQGAMPRRYEHVDRVDLWIMAQKAKHEQFMKAIKGDQNEVQKKTSSD